MSWLTDELKKDIRKVFEPRYHRELTDSDVSEIAHHLTSLLESVLKFYEAKQYENQKN